MTNQQIADDWLREHQEKRADTAKLHAQRSAVASLVGRCEGLLWDHDMLSSTERLRLFALLQETCSAFDMSPPQLKQLETL